MNPPDDGLAVPGEDEGIIRWIGVCPANSVGPATAALTPYQRQEAWNEWRLGPQCQQILQDVASREREFADALEAVFMAGIEAALRK